MKHIGMIRQFNWCYSAWMVSYKHSYSGAKAKYLKDPLSEYGLNSGKEQPQESDWLLDTSQVSTHYPDGAMDFISRLAQVDTFRAAIAESEVPPCRACFSITGLDGYLNKLWAAHNHGK